MADDGEGLIIEREIADLLDKVTFEQQTRDDRVGGLGRPEDADWADKLVGTFTELAYSAGFDASILLRLVQIAQYQQRQITELWREIEELRAT